MKMKLRMAKLWRRKNGLSHASGSADVDSRFYPKTISIVLNFAVSATWHFLGLIETSLCPVSEVIKRTTSSFEHDDGKQTAQRTIVELWFWKWFGMLHLYQNQMTQLTWGLRAAVCLTLYPFSSTSTKQYFDWISTWALLRSVVTSIHWSKFPNWYSAPYSTPTGDFTEASYTGIEKIRIRLESTSSHSNRRLLLESLRESCLNSIIHMQLNRSHLPSNRNKHETRIWLINSIGAASFKICQNFSHICRNSSHLTTLTVSLCQAASSKIYCSRFSDIETLRIAFDFITGTLINYVTAWSWLLSPASLTLLPNNSAISLTWIQFPRMLYCVTQRSNAH